MDNSVLALVGIGINISATVIGLWRMSLRYENRITRIETLLETYFKPNGGTQ